MWDSWDVNIRVLFTLHRSTSPSKLTPCVESVADRTETHAVVDNNIQASSKNISVQLNTLLPLTIECAIGLIVGGALQMQLLLLLLLLPKTRVFAIWGKFVTFCIKRLLLNENDDADEKYDADDDNSVSLLTDRPKCWWHQASVFVYNTSVVISHHGRRHTVLHFVKRCSRHVVFVFRYFIGKHTRTQ